MGMKQTTPPPLSASDAATRLGLSVESVYRYCRNGRLRARPFGRQWQIEVADLVEFKRASRKIGRPAKKSSRRKSSRRK